MMSDLQPCNRVVFFDLETLGMEPGKHRVIQFAGAAVDWPTLRVVEELEVRAQIMRGDSWQAEAVRGNVFAQRTGYDPLMAGTLSVDEYFAEHARRWNQADGCLAPGIALAKVDSFLARYRSVTMVSKRTGAPYKLTKVAGHNIAGFDLPHLRAWYGKQFFPVEFRCLDTLQLACWVDATERGVAVDAQSLSLQGLRERFGIPAAGEAHDALADVKVNIEVCQRLLFKLSSLRGL